MARSFSKAIQIKNIQGLYSQRDISLCLFLFLSDIDLHRVYSANAKSNHVTNELKRRKKIQPYLIFFKFCNNLIAQQAKLPQPFEINPLIPWVKKIAPLKKSKLTSEVLNEKFPAKFIKKLLWGKLKDLIAFEGNDNDQCLQGFLPEQLDPEFFTQKQTTIKLHIGEFKNGLSTYLRLIFRLCFKQSSALNLLTSPKELIQLAKEAAYKISFIALFDPLAKRIIFDLMAEGFDINYVPGSNDLSRQSDPVIRTHYCLPILTTSILSKQTRMNIELLESGANANQTIPGIKMSPAHAAILCQDFKTVEALSSSGADFNHSGKFHHFSGLSCRFFKVVKVQKTISLSEGSAVECAEEVGNKEIVDYLKTVTKIRECGFDCVSSSIITHYLKK